MNSYPRLSEWANPTMQGMHFMVIRKFFWCILLFFCLINFANAATVDLYVFDNPKQERQFQKLNQNFRCLVCQNETLADSNAPLAKDLRFEIYRMIKQNKSDQEIIDYLVDRYGDFVLFKPRFAVPTLVLWLGPFIMLMLALVRLYWLIHQRRKQAKKSAAYTFSEEDRQRIKHLLREY